MQGDVDGRFVCDRERVFLVVATAESGRSTTESYPLTESQLRRFLMRLRDRLSGLLVKSKILRNSDHAAENSDASRARVGSERKPFCKQSGAAGCPLTKRS